jgi:hypothetical protein
VTLLSPHFSLEELTRSRAAARFGLDNTAPPLAVASLTRWCVILGEPLRALLNVPLQVDSGFRSPAVNTVDKGATNSAHMFGCAVDVIPLGMPVLDAFRILQVSSLPFDQLIYECATWLHVGMTTDPSKTPRRMFLLASMGPSGGWVYSNA